MTTTTATPALSPVETLIAYLKAHGGRVSFRNGSSFNDRETMETARKNGGMAEAVAGGLVVDAGDFVRLVPQVGMHATINHWTDRTAVEIIAVSKTGSKITLRALKATMDPAFKPDFVPGGFVGTVVNQHEQRYTYEQDTDGKITNAHLNKRGQYTIRGHESISLGAAHHFYDYNF